MYVCMYVFIDFVLQENTENDFVGEGKKPSRPYGCVRKEDARRAEMPFYLYPSSLKKQ